LRYSICVFAVMSAFIMIGLNFVSTTLSDWLRRKSAKFS